MKKVFFVTLLLFFACSYVNAQYQGNHPPPRYYFGLGSGINSHTGIIGLTGAYRLTDKGFMQAGLGIGTWGVKSSIGFRYDFKIENTFGIGINYTMMSGLSGMTLTTESTSYANHVYYIECKPTQTLDLKLTYRYDVGDLVTFFSETGYAIPLDSKPYSVTGNHPLDETATNVINMMKPGGFILNVGFLARF